MFIFSVVFFMLICLAGGAIWYLAQSKTHQRRSLPIVLAGTFVWFAIAVFTTMGYSRPISWTPAQLISDAQVHSYLFHPGVAIYVWVKLEDEPLAIKLPWSKKRAEELQKQMRTSKVTGETVRMIKPKRSDSPEAQQLFRLTLKPSPPLKRQ